MTHFIQANIQTSIEFFDQQCDKLGHFLDTHPTSYKVVLLASHLFRSVSMFGMMQCLPFSLPVSFGVVLLPSLLYRSAIERFCCFRFTIPSLAGALSIWAGRSAAISLAAGTAFSSLGSLAFTTLGMGSLAGYLIFVCDLSHSDIEKHMQKIKKSSCCH